MLTRRYRKSSDDWPESEGRGRGWDDENNRSVNASRCIEDGGIPAGEAARLLRHWTGYPFTAKGCTTEEHHVGTATGSKRLMAFAGEFWTWCNDPESSHDVFSLWLTRSGGPSLTLEEQLALAEKIKMAAKRSRHAGIGEQPQKGQFSQLPSDVWVEVDGGKQIGNENEFPPDPARMQEKAIIDEVNMLRNDVSQRAASDKDTVEFKGLLRRLETEGKRYDEGDKLTEMLDPEKFSFRTTMIVQELISLMEIDPGLKELVPENLQGFFEGYAIAWGQRGKLWKHAMVSRRAKIAKEIFARKLEVTKREVDEKNTAILRSTKKLRGRSNGSLSDSIEMAGYYAKKHNKTYFVYLGNSYGHGVWRVGEENDALNPINNQSTSAVFSVTPDLLLTKLTIIR